MSTAKIAVVIPCYRVVDKINDVIRSIPDNIDHIIVVDDKCPEGSGQEAAKLANPKVIIIYHEKNLGVGGAVVAGYQKARDLGCDIVIKMDGDGQMDAKYIGDLIAPLLNNTADFTKGNRFKNISALKAMPKVRLFGNSILSFLVKMCSGYWSLMDPTNGYTAIRREILERLNLDKLSQGYFFESDMLINLNIINAVVKDIDIPANYQDETSSLSIKKVVVHFPFKLARGLGKRIFFKYFIYDFNMASIYIIMGIPLLLFGVIFGIVQWIDAIITGQSKPTGTILLAVLPTVIAIEMLMQAINIDINSIPRKE